MIKKLFPALIVIIFSVKSIGAGAQALTTVIVEAGKPGAYIAPTMWGIFFEDINFAADGGLSAELIKNGSFEFPQPLTGWKLDNGKRFATNKNASSILIVNGSEKEQVNNKRIVRIFIENDSGVILHNHGFRGIGIKSDSDYVLSFRARTAEGNTIVTASLSDTLGNQFSAKNTFNISKEWKQFRAKLRSDSTASYASLELAFRGKGVIEIDNISLYPTYTWKSRPNGLRADLVQLLADMKPGFIRFPGGCIVEGFELSTRYQWKKTLGDIVNRPTMINRWNNEFAHRPAPDYYQSFSLGFYEYFQLAEDIGAEPLPILNCGMACQFNSGEVADMSDIEEYINDALDLIEFANGSVNSTWGKLRASMGHPASFNLKYIGIGNEQWGEQYIERYKKFHQVIRNKYPDIKIVSSAGPSPDGELFDYASAELKKLNADIIDEHYYRNPEWFFSNAARYDKYDRKGPKIFAGEYAAQSVYTVSPDNKNNWECALSEAAFMTGLERNADLVQMSSYAPLFAHVDAWQWTPNLIWFDNLKSYGTPNYYVQKVFSNYKGDRIIRVLDDNIPFTGQNGLYASGTWQIKEKAVIIKIVNAGKSAANIRLKINGMTPSSVQGNLLSMHANPDAENSINHPSAVAPHQSSVTVKNKETNISLSPLSLTVLSIPVN